MRGSRPRASNPSTTARGRSAESLVARLLEDKGYLIVARNLRVGRDEIDLVALDGVTLVCVEVRARSAGALVHPLESITAAKRRKLRRSASRLATERGARDVRIDVVSVHGDEVEHIEGAIDFSEA